MPIGFEHLKMVVPHTKKSVFDIADCIGEPAATFHTAPTQWSIEHTRGSWVDHS